MKQYCIRYSDGTMADKLSLDIYIEPPTTYKYNLWQLRDRNSSFEVIDFETNELVGVASLSLIKFIERKYTGPIIGKVAYDKSCNDKAHVLIEMLESGKWMFYL